MNELSLFTGGAGGILGTKILGWSPKGYVEIDEECQKIIAQRIRDGLLNRAPIYGDIKAFIREGYAEAYQGMVDVLSAGFPCQPFSTAGKRRAQNDSRNKWPETITTIRLVRPRCALLENVSGLLAHKYIRRIFGDLAEAGYDARWKIISASELGAQHQRKRIWIVAYSKHQGRRVFRESRNVCTPRQGITLARGNLLERASERNAIEGRYDLPKPLLFRNVDAVANWVDRLRTVGNGQFPLAVATAWRSLSF